MSTTVTSRLRSSHQTLNSIFPATSALSRFFSARRSAPGDAVEASTVGGERPPKLFVVQPRLRPDHVLQTKLSEALNLANSLEELRDGQWERREPLEKKKLPIFSVVQNPLARSRGNAHTYFGPGTVENVKCQLNAFDADDEPDALFVNAVLSGVQQRNLERAWGKPVLDRVGLIIEIFNAHAQTKEAKLQSELAALMYKRTRLVRMRGPSGRLTFGVSGEAEVVSSKGKGTGGRGFLSGAGESEIQLQRRRIQERRDYLLREIEEVRRTRALQRYARKRCGGSDGQGLATVAVVGYTNAGKSTLVSALTHNDLYSDDRLFATVDPQLRSVILPSGRKVLLSDTVGFISDLPVQLIEAFHATLEEVVDADLLVHVIDSCAKNLDDQRFAVLEVLKQIGVSEEKIQNMIEVWNKIDLADCGPGDLINLGGNFDVFGDEGSRSNESEVMLDVTSKGACDQCSREGGLDSFLGKGEYLEDCNESIQSHKSDYSIRDGSVSGVSLEDGKMDHEEFSDEDELELVSEPSKCNIASNDISEIGMDGQKVPLHGYWEMGKSATRLPDFSRVRTSAIKGVGLQELLHVIDEKLNAQEISPCSDNYFERKWRPSYSISEEAKLGENKEYNGEIQR